MKNKVLALVTGLSSLVLLAACSNQQNGLTSTTSSSSVEQSQSSSSESSSISTSSSSSQEKKVDTSAYDSIISKYQTAVANNQTDASLNSFVVTYANSQTSSTALKPYDLKNGNYKSTVGTWKSSNGKTIIITSDGQSELWGLLSLLTKSHPISMCLIYIP